jgi:hypothetical protein
MAQEYHIVSAMTITMWAVIIAVVLLFLTLPMLAYISNSTKNVRLTISTTGLRINSDMINQTIPLENLDRGNMKLINLNNEAELKPVIKAEGKKGLRLFNYRTGWFKLQNGSQGLIQLTSWKNVVYIPTKENYCIMLSVKKPGEFIESLKKI